MSGEDLPPRPTNCPVCISGDAIIRRGAVLNEDPTLENRQPSSETGTVIDCPTCGDFFLEDLAELRLRREIEARDYKSAVVSHFIRRMQSAGRMPVKVSLKLVDDFLRRELPSAAEQVDNFILWLGDRTQPGEGVTFKHQEVYAQVGACLVTGLSWIIREAAQHIGGDASQSISHVWLTLPGWNRYSELKKGRADTNKAFMAMPFGNPTLDEVYAVFREACAETGFTLMRLDERPKAGLIDNRLRVEIQTSRFLIVDLTYDNNGAYWEGGFDEGLNKPVFYSYEKSFFRTKPSHFDANHSYTLLWDISELDTAAAELKAAIRATLPDEAKMSDDQKEVT